ncbi:MAG: hypothetical protein ABIN97_04205 [Ginsengibacter sp.]
MYSKPFTKSLIVLSAMGLLIINTAWFYKADKVIQIDVSSILNARSVTTLSKGNLITWTTGIDKENGYLTMAASAFMGDQDPHALPDNPLFPASKSHPEILLHYSNEAGAQNQTRCIPDSGEFIFKVPAHKYSDLYLSLTSSYGASSLQVILTYKDGVELRNFILPDWFKDIPENDPDFSYVAHNMGKWGNKNNLNEKDHHNIDALNIHPNPKRVLKNIKLRKLPGGYLVFWAATGVVKN